MRLWPLPASHAVRTAWSALGRPSAERLLGSFDALLYTDWMTPPQRSGLRGTTIHDLNPLHHPEWCTARTIAMHRRKDADAARKCDVVFTNSQYTADDATASLGIEPARLVVAHPGVGAGFGPDGGRAAFGGPYVLGVGTLEPRKNLRRLVEAWRLLEGGQRLVLAGGAGWGEQPGLDDEGIVLPGYVPDEGLPALYRGADAFVYPSLFEGFGIPVVEAMACGTPVVVSSHPSLDEACGSAAVRVDPNDSASIAAGIMEAVTRRDELVPAGYEHAARFSWGANGRTMIDALVERSRA
jgi:glycosyltransferase involved in cell wall biosynthesis